MPKKILIAFLLVIGVYLYYGYSHIYNTISFYNLHPPKTEETIIVKNPETEKKIKYVALGDSLTAGTGASSQEESLPYYFAKKLSTRGEVTLINLGIPGAKIKDVINFELDKAIAEKADYITLFIGTNDMHDFVRVESFRKDLKFVLDKLESTEAKIIVLNLPLLGSSKLYYPPYDLMFDFMTRQFNEAIKRDTLKRDVALVDLYKATKGIFTKDSQYYASDEFHPSGRGYQFWGDLINAD